VRDKSFAFKKGSDFETSVFLTLKNELREAFVMCDVHIPFTPIPAQIDIVVVIGWSFHVLELKNYDIGLVGRLGDNRWTAKTNTRSFSIQNPIMQNTTQSFKLIQILRAHEFPPPREIKGFVVVPITCRLDVDKHLKQAIVTVDQFIASAKTAKPGAGDIEKLRRLFLQWKV